MKEQLRTILMISVRRVLISLLLSFFLSSSLIAKATPSSQNENRVVIGYFPFWAPASLNYLVRDVPADRLTHLIYAFANISEAGEIEPGDFTADLNKAYPGDVWDNGAIRGNINQLMLLKKRHPHLKTLISIGGWDRSARFSDVALTEAGRTKFALSILRFMKKYQFDGVEIDWRYPMTGGKLGNKERPKDRENLTLLLQEIRKQFDLDRPSAKNRWILATTASIGDRRIGTWEPDKVTKIVDFVNLFGYWFHGHWNRRTNHHSLLYSIKTNEPSVNRGVQEILEAGGDPKKLILGVSTEGISWGGVPSKNHGLYQRARFIPIGTWDNKETGTTGTFTYPDILGFLNSKEYTFHRDEKSMAPTLYSPTRFKGHFITYEDEISLGKKLNYIQNKSMGGISFWGFSGDHQLDYPLMDLAVEHLNPELQPNILGVTQFRVAGFRISATAIGWLAVGFIPVVVVPTILLINRRREKQKLLTERKRFGQLTSTIQRLEIPLKGALLTAGLLESDQKESKIPEGFPLLELKRDSQDLLLFTERFLKSSRSEPDLPIAGETGKSEAVDLVNTVQDLLPALQYEQGAIPVRVDIHATSPIPALLSKAEPLQIALFTIFSDLLRDSQTGVIDLDVSSENGEIHFTISAGKKIPVAQFDRWREERESMLAGCEERIRSLGGILKIAGPEEEKRAVKLTMPAAPDSLPPVEEAEERPTTIHLSLAEERLKTIQEFSDQISQTRDLTSLLETARDTIAKDQKVADVTLMKNDEKEIEALSQDPSQYLFLKADNFENYQFAIQGHDSLTQQDLDYFQSLIRQIRTIRQSLNEITGDPRLLSELHEILSRREELLFIKSERGYSGIVDEGKGAQKLIYLCLKSIKVYFDDDFLLQVHRSWLVNPEKVESVNRISKLKYEIKIRNYTIPIGRNYLKRLKRNYPTWF